MECTELSYRAIAIAFFIGGLGGVIAMALVCGAKRIHDGDTEK